MVIRLKAIILLVNIILMLCIYSICSADEGLSPNLFINSDRLTYDKNKNLAYFKGNVVVWFEDLIMTTSDLEIRYSNNLQNHNQIDIIIIPNKLSLLKTLENQVLIAANGIYYMSENKLILQNVELMRENNILKTPKLIYYAKIKKIKTN